MGMLSKSRLIHSVQNSNLTGTPTLVTDWRQMSLSIETQTNSASRFTVIGTNDDGLNSALRTPSQTLGFANGWSLITTLTQAGMYAFDPGAMGYRWINVFRPSASSATIIVNGRT